MADAALWDVDTQVDFMLPEGKLYVRGAEKLRPNLRKLYAAARRARLPIVASVDAHLVTDEEMKVWPLHCLIGTDGQKKLPETLLPRRVTVPPDGKATPPPLRAGTQVILEKCHLDPFTHPRARELVLKSGIERWIVFGIMTDYSVRLTGLGLLKLGRRVTVVSDAICGKAEESSAQAVIELQAAGADFKTTAAAARGLSAGARGGRVKLRRK